jgi:NAD(P)-dependent dehydrogenase (short-subunit alcohol dehydrogenase family)
LKNISPKKAESALQERKDPVVENTKRLEDQVVIITGGALGIGKAFALAMAKEGARIVIADLDLDASKAAAGELRQHGGKALPLRVDVSSVDDTERMARETVEKFARIDALSYERTS